MAYLVGADGRDVLTGTAAGDTIAAGRGSDTVDGGDGDDVITDDGGTRNTLRGGNGNDRITLINFDGTGSIWGGVVQTHRIDAGAGDDTVRAELGFPGVLTVDLGSGNDWLTLGGDLSGYRIDQTIIATGAGQDRITFTFGFGDTLRYALHNSVVITDFQAGAGGDVLDLEAAIQGVYLTFDASAQPALNPFTSHHLLLIQSGADTIVRLDFDGSSSTSGEFDYTDIAVLKGVTASQLTAYNFAGYDPAGAVPGASAINGTAAADRLFANATGSTVQGLAGADWLIGSGMNDDLRGGDDNDVIEGGLGNDKLQGDAGNDVLSDSYGSDSFSGGAGDDLITWRSPNIINELYQFQDTLTVSGGDGNDRVHLEITPYILSGGVPNYRFHLAQANVDLGTGDDRLFIHNWLIDATVTLGAGQDRVTLGDKYLLRMEEGPHLVINDFQAGNSGDVIDLSGAVLQSYAAWAITGNPFADGYLKISQLGADVVVSLDFDGGGGSDSLIQVVRLSNVSLAALTAFNFNGFAPDGSALTGTVKTGTANADLIDGNGGNDQLNGGGGNDEIFGWYGNDVIDGGAGDDTIQGSLGNDQLSGGDGDDTIEDLGRGNDVINGGAGNDRIRVEHYYSVTTENVTINAGDGNDDVYFANGADTGSVTIDLGAGDDRLTLATAMEGGTTITLGAGADTITLDDMLSAQARGPITVNDFATGAGGDRLDWKDFFQFVASTFTDEQTYDPFALPSPSGPGFALLVQSGADTLLQWNNGGLIKTLITFKNTTASSFTDYNLGTNQIQTGLTGTANDDRLVGGNGGETISGAGGDDNIVGRGGADQLNGGDGWDLLDGGAGNDTLRGGAGRDHLDGGDGNDNLEDLDGSDVLRGAGGDDTIKVVVTAASDTDLMGATHAGAGDDNLIIRGGRGYFVDMGAGIDQVDVQSGSGETWLSLGDGSDVVTAHALTGALSLYFESGNDRIKLASDFSVAGGGLVIIEDLGTLPYTTDVIDFAAFLTALTGGSWNTSQNPFAAGLAQLRQVEGGTELWFNPSGTPGADSVRAVFIRHFGPSMFNASHFGGYDPAAQPVTDPDPEGPPAVAFEYDQYSSGAFNNSVDVVASTPPDSPYASVGVLIWQNPDVTGVADIINSGSITADIAIYVDEDLGIGTYYHASERLLNSGIIDGDVYLSYGNDQVINTGEMNGYTDLGQGKDLYDGTSGVHFGLVDGAVGDDTLRGGNFTDYLDGGRGSDLVTGGGGADVIFANQGNDALDGGIGLDTLSCLTMNIGVTVDLELGRLTGTSLSYIRNFESVIGSVFRDTLRGSTKGETLEGAAGDDTIDGRAGDDVLIGDSGADTITTGAGADRVLFSAGDGNDVVIDFGSGDKLEIYGYDSALAIEQAGSDVRVRLSATDSILLKNLTVAAIAPGSILFTHNPLTDEPGAILPHSIKVQEATFRVGAGETYDLDDIQPIYHYMIGYYLQAIRIDSIYGPATIANAGTIKVHGDASAAPLSGTSQGHDLWTEQGYPSSVGATVFNQAGGLFEVSSVNGDAWGWFGVYARNAGTLRVKAEGGDAKGMYSPGEVHNSGLIDVSATGHAVGVDDVQNWLFNSGTIKVHGGLSSSGIFATLGFTASTKVNAGTITVTDDTAAIDSTGLQLQIAGSGAVWNTGTITADYAVRTSHVSGSSGMGLTLYNTGALNGMLVFMHETDAVFNRGTITGPVTLGSANDLYDGRGGRVDGEVAGEAGNDQLYGGGFADKLNGGIGDDEIAGGGGDDLLTGGTGKDVFHFESGFGHDEVADFAGGADGDLIRVAGYSGYTSIAQQGSDVLVTFSAADTILLKNIQLSAILPANFAYGATPLTTVILPTAPTDTAPPSLPGETRAAFPAIAGTAAADTLVGGSGHDEIDGLAGADSMYGGYEDDTYFADQLGDLIFEFAGGGTDIVMSAASHYLFAEVENLVLTGAGDFFGVGNELANAINGNSGSNLLIAGGGNDTLRGGGGIDSLFGQDGADQLFGDGGIDYLVGGIGNDTLDGGIDADALYGEAGDDTLWGGTDFQTDIFVGGEGNDVLHADSGMADYDLIDGGAGDDTYYVDTGNDLTFEAVGGGTDTVYANVGGANNGVYLYANVENLVLVNTTAFGVGNELANTMTGSASANWLLGGAGNDVLNGKAGNDVLFGEGGSDTFVFQAGTGGDVIGDFEAGTDKIDLSAYFSSFAQVQAAMIENGGTTAINLKGGDLLVINGVANAALHASDFILAAGGAPVNEAPIAAIAAPAVQSLTLGDTLDASGADLWLVDKFDTPQLAIRPDPGAGIDLYY